MTFSFIYAQNDCDNLNPPADRIIDGTMPGGVNLSTLLPFNWSSDIVIIKGQLNIDVEQEIGNAEVYCMPGAAIHVLPDLDFRIFGSHFQGCSKLWKGIIIENNGFLKIDGESIIEDAEYAIHFKGDCEFYCVHSNFINNYVGIYAEPTTDLKNIYGYPIIDCHFEEAGYLKPNYEGSIIGDQLYSLAGIYLNDVSEMTIGNSEEYPNYFTGMRNGILNIGGGTNIQYAHVSDLVRGTDWAEGYDKPDQVSGIAFYTMNNDFMEVSNSMTDGVRGGICSINSDIDIHNNEFKNHIDPDWSTLGEYCFFLKGSDFEAINIKDNLVSDNWTLDLWAQDITRPYEFNIIHNSIRNMYFNNCYNGNVNDNYDLYNTIWLFDINNFTLSDNILPTQEDRIRAFKINIKGGGENYLFNNNAENQISDESCSSTVFYSQGSDGNSIICNPFKRAFIGAEFDDLNIATEFRGNTLENFTNSLWLNEAEIGKQPYRGNVFIGDNTGVIEGSDPVSIALKSMFTINPLDPPDEGELEPASYDPSEIENIWFVPDYKKNNAFCNDSLIVDSEEKRKPWWTKLSCDSLKIYLDSVLTETINTPYKSRYLWRKKRYYFKYLKQDTMLRDSCSFIDSLLLDIKGDTIDKYVDADISIDNANKLSVEQEYKLEQYYLQINSINEQINKIDSLLLSDTLNIDSNLEQKRDLIYQLKDVLEEFHIFKDDMDTQTKNRLVEALAAVDDLQASTIYETTQKRFWQLSLKKRLQGKESLTSTEWDEIKGIAEMCPLEAGKAVYSARALYQTINDTLLQYDDDELCGLYDKSKLILKNTNISEKSLVDIFPNPAKQEWNIKIENKDQKQIVVEVVDMQGRVLKRFNFGTKTNIMEKIQIPDMDTGILFAKIYMDDKLYSTKKLLKLK